MKCFLITRDVMLILIYITGFFRVILVEDFISNYT